ncbi:MATE family efflux transporter [uncultured Treponema sp.]|uniref:MATE family efflux transporter n=1 Tax=uncultured Treponema sp. TaxID=162155 RepID=UPI0025F0EDFE|nr:MATE family efflux transporter [uncultured Treponema sp.]
MNEKSIISKAFHFDRDFKAQLIQIALPVTVQVLIEASLSLIDQIMIGRLGSEAISGIGLAGKFISLYHVVLSSIVSAAGILISQYFGAKNKKGINQSFFLLFYSSFFVAAVFFTLSIFSPNQIMSFYSKDYGTVAEASVYLKWRTIGFFPCVLTMFISAMLRNMKRAKLPAFAGVVAIFLNTILNCFLIFGLWIFPKMGSAGAALASSIAQLTEMLILLLLFLREEKKQNFALRPVFAFEKDFVYKVAKILFPILLGEFMWSLGENMYAVIYGHLGTEPCAAMTLMYPIQGIAIGALCGVSSAAGIITGNSLGASDNNKAWSQAMGFVKLTLTAGILIGIAVISISPLYVRLFNVAPETRLVTIKILVAFSVVFTAKVFNMVVGGGVLQSGGQTKFLTAVNIIGTWGFGVPLGFISAYVFHLPIWWVYFMLSLEELVRVGISVWLLRSRKWMKNVTENQEVA